MINYIIAINNVDFPTTGKYIGKFNSSGDLPTTAPFGTYDEGDIAIVINENNAIYEITTRTPGVPDDTYVWTDTNAKAERTINGNSLTGKFDEQLDVGFIEIPYSSLEEEYPRFTKVKIALFQTNNNTKVFEYITSGDSVTVESKKRNNSLLYRHNIALMEVTKLLEKTISKEMTFTQPTDTTDINDAGVYSLADVVDIILSTNPSEIESNLNTTRIATLSSTSRTLLENILSPEFYFNNSLTLREVLNEVFKYVNGVCRLNLNKEITIDFFNEVKNLIDIETNSFSKELDSDIKDYATSIRTDSKNIVNGFNRDGIVITYPNDKSGVLGQKDVSRIQSDLQFIPLPEKILILKKVIVYGDFSATPPSGEIYNLKSVDISRNVLEKSTRDTLDIADTTTDNRETRTLYQSNTLYYTYKGNKIQGLDETTGTTNTIKVLENVLENAIRNLLWPTANKTGGTVTLPSSTDGLTYKVEYQVYEDVKYDIEREDIEKINKNTTILSNQGDNVLSFEQQTNNLYGEIQRLGNEDIVYTQITRNLNSIFELGDITNDNFVITERELFLYNDFITCKYGLTKNFNRLSQFIGVNAQYRPYELPADNVYISNLNYKEYAEIKATNGGLGIQTNNSLLTSVGIDTFMETFKSGTRKPPARNAVLFPKPTGYPVSLIIEEDEKIHTALSTLSGVGTLLFSYNFNSPTIAGYQNVSYDFSTRKLQPVRYTDFRGQYEKIDIKFATDIENGSTPNVTSDRLDFGRNYPLINDVVDGIVTVPTSSVLIDIPNFIVHHDRSSIDRFMYQLQTVPNKDYNDIVIIGRSLTLQNPLVKKFNSVSTNVGTYSQYEGICPDVNVLTCQYPNDITNPETREGFYAFVTSTNTYWIWDVELNNWRNTYSSLEPEDTSEVVKLYTHENETYNTFDNLQLKPNATLQNFVLGTDYSIVNDSQISITTNAIDNKSSYVITDNNDNIILAINQPTTTLDVITINFNNKRGGISEIL